MPEDNVPDHLVRQSIPQNVKRVTAVRGSSHRQTIFYWYSTLIFDRWHKPRTLTIGRIHDYGNAESR